MTSPQVAVIVSAYNRSDLLTDLVAALRSQSFEDFEGILVDNGSTDDTHDTLVRLVGHDPRFRVIRIEDNAGPAPARNMSWRLAAAPWVAFTDDDCAPEPDWLERLLAHTGTHEIVQGRTVPAELPESYRPGWFDRSQRIEGWSSRFETCNVMFARDLLERHDGFDERFQIAMGEDTDLGLRAVAAGARTAFADDAVVVHHVFSSTFRDYLHQRRRYSEVVELMKANPDARQLLKGGLVLRGVHLLVWSLPAAIGVAVVSGWWWLPVLLVVAWAGLNTYRTRHRPFGLIRRFGYSLLHLVGYSYETVCFAAASIRYRALVI